MAEQHARVWRRSGGDFVVEDLASSTGTWLNGRRLPPNQAMQVCPGDELVFGAQDADALRYRVKMVHESVWDMLENGQGGKGKMSEEDREPELAAA